MFNELIVLMLFILKILELNKLEEIHSKDSLYDEDVESLMELDWTIVYMGICLIGISLLHILVFRVYRIVFLVKLKKAEWMRQKEQSEKRKMEGLSVVQRRLNRKFIGEEEEEEEEEVEELKKSEFYQASCVFVSDKKEVMPGLVLGWKVVCSKLILRY